MEIVWFLLVGLVAGWLGGWMLGNRVHGVGGDVIVGMLGAMLAGYVFSTLGLQLGVRLWASIAVAALGALILIVVLRLVKAPASLGLRRGKPRGRQNASNQGVDAESR
jgi:uncharacterized membrane protein YeaQ/YmgE (transglycosylase-associated protein family)